MNLEDLLSQESPCAEYRLFDQEELKIWQPVTGEFFEKLQKLLAGEDDAALVASAEIGPRQYRTYTCGQQLWHVWYNDDDCSLRVATVPLSGTRCGHLPLQPPETRPALCEPSLTVMALDYTYQRLTDANGMSYVLRLEDGSFVIWDGGRPEDADRLYTYLCHMQEQLKPGEPVEIAAWILTHSHSDHYGAFQAFSRMYADRVALRRVLFNPIACDPATIKPQVHDPFLNEEVFDLIARYPGAQALRPLPGQRLRLGQAEIEFLQTYEDILPVRMDWLNEASVVSRLHIAGQKILFLADAELKADRKLEEFGPALKSDLMQVAHHGFSGGTDVLLRNISPRVLMWTTNSECYITRTLRNWHNGFNHRAISYPTVEFSLVADNACKVLRLPFLDRKSITYLTFPEFTTLQV